MFPSTVFGFVLNFLLKNFQGCIAVYLSRFNLFRFVESWTLALIRTLPFFVLALSGRNSYRIACMFLFVNNFFHFFWKSHFHGNSMFSPWNFIINHDFVIVNIWFLIFWIFILAIFSSRNYLCSYTVLLRKKPEAQICTSGFDIGC